MWKKLWCALREHPHPKNRRLKEWPYDNQVIETCLGCGQQRDTFIGEGAF